MTVSFNFSLLAKAGAEVIKHAEGDAIFSTGDPATAMFVVRDGEVDILADDNLIDTVGPGDIFGEMALVDGTTRSADARARTDCEIVPVDERAFNYLVSETPHFALQVMRTLTRRLRRMNQVAGGI